jgi:dTMP kinase
VTLLFITFEGTEGSGKSSQIGALAEYLRQKGYAVLTTREPGGTPIGEQVRAVISNLDNTAMHARTEILLFQASRAQLVEQVIRPHLSSGGLVLSDRYADSTLAYQGYGYQTDLQRLKTLVDFATGGLKPDLTIFFDLDVEEGLRRRAKGGEWNRLDALDLPFYQRVRLGYDRLMQAEPARWVTIDASGTPEKVQVELRRVVGERLGVQK